MAKENPSEDKVTDSQEKAKNLIKSFTQTVAPEKAKEQQDPKNYELSIKVEDLRKASLFVATPMYGGQCHGLYMKSALDLQALCTRYGIDVRFSFIFNESLITRARNYLADEFLRSNMTHMVFIDSDINFDPNDILAMVAISIKNEGFDIVGGPYPKKAINWNNVAAAARGNLQLPPGELENVIGDFVFNPVNNGQQQFLVSQPLEVLEVGTGLMCIKRETFIKWKEFFPEKAYLPDHRGTAHFDGSREIHAYFDCVVDPQTRRYLSEDYMFCQFARKAGMHIWLCPWMRTQHIGAYHFTGDMKKIATMTGQLFP